MIEDSDGDNQLKINTDVEEKLLKTVVPENNSKVRLGTGNARIVVGTHSFCLSKRLTDFKRFQLIFP